MVWCRRRTGASRLRRSTTMARTRKGRLTAPLQLLRQPQRRVVTRSDSSHRIRPGTFVSALGGDYALDISVSSPVAAYLHLDYGGYGACDIFPDPTPCNPIDRSQSITIKARLAAKRGSSACQYQYFDVLATYKDTSGNTYTDTNVGQVRLMHLYNCTCTSIGTTIPTDATKDHYWRYRNPGLHQCEKGRRCVPVRWRRLQYGRSRACRDVFASHVGPLGR